MGEPQKLSLTKAMSYQEAIKLIDENDKLSTSTMYKLGKLNSYCASPVRSFNKASIKATKRINEEITKLHESATNKDDDGKRQINQEIIAIKENFMEENQDTLDKEDLEIMVPDFKLSEFTGKDGVSLVPQKFFTLMGSIIIDESAK